MYISLTSLRVYSQPIRRAAVDRVVPIAANNASSNFVQGFVLIVAHSADGDFDHAALFKPQVDWKTRHTPRIDDPIKREVRVSRPAIAADLPLITRCLHFSWILRIKVRELRKIEQHPAVIAMQLVTGQHDLFTGIFGRLLDRGLVKETGVGRDSADMTNVHDYVVP